MEKTPIEVKQIDWFDDHWYRIRYLNEAKVEVEEYYASVTTKLGILAKPHLLRWYGEIGYQEARRKTREAADRGTRIHWAWYTYVQGGAVIYQNPRTPAYTREEIEEIHKRFNNNVWIVENQDEHYDFLKLVEMFKRLDPQIVESERKLFNIEHKEAGTGDNIFGLKEGKYEISGAKPLVLPAGMYLGDLKTGASVTKENLMQISAYVYCAESMGYDTFQGALIYHTQSRIKTGIPGLSVTYLTRDEIEQHYSDFRDISRVWERQSTSKPIIRQLPCLVTRDNQWTLSSNSSEDKASEPTEKPSTEPSSQPKPETSKPETGASNKTSDSSSKPQESIKDKSKTPSKKES
jgi:hypothetical protein